MLTRAHSMTSSTLMQLLNAQTPEQFTDLGRQLVDVRALLHADAFELTESDSVPDWIRAWPAEMQTVFCCPTWNSWMLQQIQQWESQLDQQQIPLAMTNLVKATVFYLRSGELDQLPQ